MSKPDTKIHEFYDDKSNISQEKPPNLSPNPNSYASASSMHQRTTQKLSSRFSIKYLLRRRHRPTFSWLSAVNLSENRSALKSGRTLTLPA